MDGRERETMLIDDLTKSRAKFQQVKEELVKTQDLLCAKRTENESVRAENAVYLKEVSASEYLNERVQSIGSLDDVFTRNGCVAI